MMAQQAVLTPLHQSSGTPARQGKSHIAMELLQCVRQQRFRGEALKVRWHLIRWPARPDRDDMVLFVTGAASHNVQERDSGDHLKQAPYIDLQILTGIGFGIHL